MLRSLWLKFINGYDRNKGPGMSQCFFCREGIVFDPSGVVWVLAKGGTNVGNRYTCERSPENRHAPL
jgi:hypothetical protein